MYPLKHIIFRSKLIAVFVCFFLTAFSITSLASSALSTEVPSFFNRSNTVTLNQIGLDHACFIVLINSFALPCNPAFLAQKKNDSFIGNLYIGDQLSTLDKMRQLFDQDKKIELVEELIREKNIVELEAGAWIGYRSSQWALAYTPLRGSYFSIVRNQSNPQIAMHAMKEQIISIQAGREISSDLFLGLQTRLVDREFVHDSFSLLEAVTSIDEILQVKKQTALYIEPSIAYIYPTEFKPRASLMVTNLGFANEKFEEVPMAPNVNAGLGVTLPMIFGDTDIGFNYQFERYKTNSWDQLRLGINQKTGNINSVFGWDSHGFSTGIFGQLRAARIGILYKKNKAYNKTGNYDYANTVTSEFAISM